MTEQPDQVAHIPFKLAVVIDGFVVDTIVCDERSWAMFTSNPKFVDLTNATNPLQIGDQYNATE